MTPDEIFKAVHDFTGFTKTDLRGKSRKRPIIGARKMFADLARAQGMTYPRIAQLLNKKDHTTIMNLCKHTKARPLPKPEPVKVRMIIPRGVISSDGQINLRVLDGVKY